jgi:hypothetical protein
MIVRTIVDPTVLAGLVDEESTMVGGGVMSAT